MNIILITKKSIVAPEIINGLINKNIPIKAIIIEKRKAVGIIKKIYNIIKKQGFIELFLSLQKKIRQKLMKETWLKDSYYGQFTENVITVSDINSENSMNELRKIKPDIFILAGAGILKNSVIQLAEIGVYNAHPGLLPYYRGVDVIPWAIYNGDEIGVTIHKVDSGIDTGDICMQKTIKIEPWDNIDSLRQKANILSGELMGDFIYRLIHKPESIEFKINEKKSGRQYYKMDRKTLKDTEKKLKDIAKKKN